MKIRMKFYVLIFILTLCTMNAEANACPPGEKWYAYGLRHNTQSHTQEEMFDSWHYAVPGKFDFFGYVCESSVLKSSTKYSQSAELKCKLTGGEEAKAEGSWDDPKAPKEKDKNKAEVMAWAREASEHIRPNTLMFVSPDKKYRYQFGINCIAREVAMKINAKQKKPPYYSFD